MNHGFRHTTVVSHRGMKDTLSSYLPRTDVGTTIPPVIDGKIPSEFIPSGAGSAEFTNAEKTKLAGIEELAQKNVATNLSLTGTGDSVVINSSTGTFVTLPIASNLRGGIMTRAMFNKLASIEEGATKWRAPTLIDIGLENVNNTSDADKPISTAQAAALDLKENKITAGSVSQYFSGTKTWRNLAADIRSTVLTGLAAGLNQAISAGDTILVAMAKLQKQIESKEAAITSGTTSQYLRGDKTLGSFVDDVKAVAINSVLSGLSLVTGSAVLETDSILVAIGKLQRQITSLSNSVDGIIQALPGYAVLSQANIFLGKMTIQGSLTLESSAFTKTKLIPIVSNDAAIDPTSSNVFEVGTLTANITLTLGTGATGQSIQIRFQQDATGNRTVTLPTNCKVAGSLLATSNRASWLYLTKISNGNWEGNWFNVPA